MIGVFWTSMKETTFIIIHNRINIDGRMLVDIGKDGKGLESRLFGWSFSTDGGGGRPYERYIPRLGYKM